MPGKPTLIRSGTSFLTPLVIMLAGFIGYSGAWSQTPPPPTIDKASQTFSSGDYAKALREAQEAVEGLDAFQALVPASASGTLSSLVLREDDPALLKSYCLFEMASFAFLSKKNDEAESLWGGSYDALSGTDATKNPFERRAAVIVDTLKLEKASNFAASFQILETANHQIRDYPLSDESGQFPYQQKLELLLISADALCAGVRDLNASSSDAAAVHSLIGKQVVAFVGDKGLYGLLMGSKTAAVTHEQILDQLLFKDLYAQISAQLGGVITEICRSAPPTIRGSSEALALLWATQLPPDQMEAFQKSLPSPAPELSANFGQRLVEVVKIAASAGDTSTQSILAPTLNAYESSLLLVPAKEKVDLVNLVSSQANTDFLLRLLDSAAGTPTDAGWSKEVQMAKLRVCSERSRPKDAIAIGESLLKSDPSPAPDVYYLLGVSYAKAEQPDAAIKNLAEFVSKADSDSHLALGLELLGKLYVSAGKRSEALATFQQLAQLFPNSDSAQRTRSFLISLSPAGN